MGEWGEWPRVANTGPLEGETENKIKMKQLQSWNLELLQHNWGWGLRGCAGHNSSTFLHCWATLKLFNLHHSKEQSMEEGPFVRNCQQRQGPQAWSPPPRVKSAYLGCHLDMTGPQGQGRGVKLLTTLNVTMAILYYERHARQTYIKQFH